MVDEADDTGTRTGSIDQRHLLLIGAGPGLGEPLHVASPKVATA